MFSRILALTRHRSPFSSTLLVSHRRSSFKTPDGKPRSELTINDVDIIANPKEKLLDEYMKQYGAQRLNFKRNDFDIWRQSFGRRHVISFVCLKGTDRILFTLSHTTYLPVPPENDMVHQMGGFLLVDREFRGSDIMKMAEYVLKRELRHQSENPVGYFVPPSRNWWTKMMGDTKYGHVQSVSYYKPEEMQIPKNMKFDGIFIKNATEVPDEDIVKYDQSVFPYERSKYMLNMLRDPAGFGRVAYDENGKVIGFGTVIIYPSGECVLTPLYADGSNVAQAIFKSILENIPLDDERLLRFQIRSIDQCPGGLEWIQPFVKCPIEKEIMGYGAYTTKRPIVNYKKVFVNAPNTTCFV